VKNYSRELVIAFLLGALLILLAVAVPEFFKLHPLLSLLAREAPTLVVACGMAMIIICRQIDISVGSQFAVCSVCAGALAAMHWPVALVLAASIFLGAMLGAFNGALVAGLQLPSIVVTLATMVTWREALRWKRQGEFINLPDGVQWFGLDQIAGQSALVIFAAGLLIALLFAAKNLAAGRFLYAVGSESEAARLAGIRPRLVTFWTFVIMGALTGCAALMNVLQSPQVDPKSGLGLELKTISAAVIGGISISGGRGRLCGMFLGLLLLICINPALTCLRVEAYWERAIQGAIILLAIVADGWRGRNENRS
jgi:rhamnose transport system permease protein